MEGSFTPKKQVQFKLPTQEPTPPPTIQSKVRPEPNSQAQLKQLLREQEAEVARLQPLRETQKELEERENERAIAFRPKGLNQVPSTDDEPESDITRWLYSPNSEGKRRQRFNSFVHSLYPSNDEFSKCLQPLNPLLSYVTSKPIQSSRTRIQGS